MRKIPQFHVLNGSTIISRTSEVEGHLLGTEQDISNESCEVQKKKEKRLCNELVHWALKVSISSRSLFTTTAPSWVKPNKDK